MLERVETDHLLQVIPTSPRLRGLRTDLVVIKATRDPDQSSFTGEVGFERSALKTVQFSSVQFSSVAQLYPTLCDPMNRSTPGLPVNHHLPEFTQTHIH